MLALIQDKLAQKQFFADNGLPTSRFVAMDAPSVAAVDAFGARAVQKLRFGGYDGRGVAVLPVAPRPEDFLPGPSLLEGFVDAAMEIAVVVARRTSGQTAAYPAVEMHFDENNVLDMLAELQTAALLAKVVSENAAVLDAMTVLRMATIGSARVLRRDHEIGSIEQGKWADLTCIDLMRCSSQPVYDPVSHVVYAVRAGQVSDAWVAGRHQLDDGELTGVDTASLFGRTNEWQSRIAAARSSV